MANMNPNRPGPQTGNKQDTHTHIQRNLRSNLKVRKKRKFNFCLESSCGHAACDIGPVSSASFAPGEASRGAGSDGQSGKTPGRPDGSQKKMALSADELWTRTARANRLGLRRLPPKSFAPRHQRKGWWTHSEIRI